MDEGEVPEKWKEAEIVPIHKGGSKAIMANFRPVALTSVICLRENYLRRDSVIPGDQCAYYSPTTWFCAW